MSVNVELLDRVMEQIEKEPDRWNQSYWLMDYPRQRATDDDGSIIINCETAFCFAGWAATLEGGKWMTGGELLAEQADIDWGTSVYTEHYHGRNLVSAFDRAARLLGLTDDQADELFYSNNTIADLRQIVARFKAEAADE